MSYREPSAPAIRRDAIVRGLATALWFAIGCFAIAFVAIVGLLLVRPRHGHDRTRSDALEIRSSVLLYVGQEPDAGCPTMADLRRVGVLDRSRATEDGWGEPFAVLCRGDDIDVISSGPDRVFHTEDDIH